MLWELIEEHHKICFFTVGTLFQKMLSTIGNTFHTLYSKNIFSSAQKRLPIAEYSFHCGKIISNAIIIFQVHNVFSIAVTAVCHKNPLHCRKCFHAETAFQSRKLFLLQKMPFIEEKSLLKILSITKYNNPIGVSM